MLQDNPLLAQLKQQLHSQTPRIEGVVKAHEKGYGFLETDSKKSYFISANNMKKVLDGDKVSGVLTQNGDKTAFEPETLLQAAFETFLGQVNIQNQLVELKPDNANKLVIRSKVDPELKNTLKNGDWVKAKIIAHPLNGNAHFSAEIIEFIVEEQSLDCLWLLALAKNNLDAFPPKENNWSLNDNDGIQRIDLTDKSFFTIDNQETQDMDDALSISQDEQGNYILRIAIADPSAYITENSEDDHTAYMRCFSTYLPGFTVPMLPKSLANELCSLKENEKRPAIVCQVTITQQGDIVENATEFNLAWVKSKAKLNYQNVSDFVDNNTPLKYADLSEQLHLLLSLAKTRATWRYNNALLFKDNPEYHFIFGHDRKLVNIVKESKLTAHKMVEEAMIIANQVFTHKLISSLGFGLFNIHQGFETKYLDSITKILVENKIDGFNKERLASFDGYKDLRHLIEDNVFLEYRLRRFQASADFSFVPHEHFGLGFNAYATWTSPIRKYGDLYNHRLLKAILQQKIPNKPDEQMLSIINERRKRIRFTERDVRNSLYKQFLTDKIGQQFDAQIIDINRGGAKIRLTDIGATAFMPLSLIYPAANNVALMPDIGQIYINDKMAYQLLDSIRVSINSIKADSATIIVKNEPKI